MLVMRPLLISRCEEKKYKEGNKLYPGPLSIITSYHAPLQGHDIMSLPTKNNNSKSVKLLSVV